MKIKPLKRIPALVALGVVLIVCLFRVFQWSVAERFECITYDIRARAALKFSPAVATNLGFVFINDESVDFVRTKRRELGYNYGLYWPRSVYGRLVEELSDQGAMVCALDVILPDLRPDHPPVIMANGDLIDSDVFLADRMRRAGNVILGAPKEIKLPALFRTNALAIGDIDTDKDSDSILRRAQAFRTQTNWHQAFRQAQFEGGFDLERARVTANKIILSRQGSEEPRKLVFPLDQDGNFDLADFVGDKIPPGMARKAKPFSRERIWHMGIQMAARHLHLDLDHAEIDLPHGRITLKGVNGVQRTIPVDSKGYFYIDWCLKPTDPRLTKEAIENLLVQNKARLDGHLNEVTNRWKDKLVVVGSTATGNDLTDWGATPLDAHTFLVSMHWNVANSLLTGRFVHRLPVAADLALIALLGFVTAFMTWQLRVWQGILAVALTALLYIAIALAVYIYGRIWIPITLPVIGAMVINYICTVAWRLVFEEAEGRRIKGVFSMVVSEKIINELLAAKNLALGGARRQITVLFADVRGFTELTDSSQERVANQVRDRKLSGDAAEACYDQQARETLKTVNDYLGLVADTIIRHDGTLDKFIGDCVMAFWGAPAAQPQHAVLCVRAAIEAQRAIYDLNARRTIENQKLEIENLARVSAGLEVKSILPILLLGTGINTGMATVGLMGSGAKQKNYTVFGREVNLASRLEGLSGRGRIFISESTYLALVRDAPDLAEKCAPRPPEKVKGISAEVKIYEVDWRVPGTPEQTIETGASKTSDSTITSILQRG